MQIPVGLISSDHSCQTCVHVHRLSDRHLGPSTYEVTSVKLVTTYQLGLDDCLFHSQARGMLLRSPWEKMKHCHVIVPVLQPDCAQGQWQWLIWCAVVTWVQRHLGSFDAYRRLFCEPMSCQSTFGVFGFWWLVTFLHKITKTLLKIQSAFLFFRIRVS